MVKKIWEVDFDVIGPISIKREIQFRQEKGFDKHQFYSDIKISRSSTGLKATITAYAESMEMAEIVAYVYFGRMRDVLTLINDIPIQLHKYETQNSGRRTFSNRRLLTESDVITAFKMARKFESEQPRLLRAIGWYSKGKLSHNTIDQFSSFWNVIEILAIKYHTPTIRTKSGTINQVYQLFSEHFGPIEEWNLPAEWIDSTYKKRNEIVHGGEETTLNAIIEISKYIPLLEQTSKRILNSIIDSKYDENEFAHYDF